MDTPTITQFLDSWKDAPEETDSGYFRVWQRTAVELQKALRRWIPELYFEKPERFEDRAAAWPIIVYAASRPCYGHPKTEFTYDIAEPDLLKISLRGIGNTMRAVLAPIEARLRAAARPDLAVRYSPVWHQDILRAVKQKPRTVITLLAAEARLVNAVIDLGATGNITRFERASTLALRSVAGHDMRVLVPRVLDLTTRVLLRKETVPIMTSGSFPANMIQ